LNKTRSVILILTLPLLCLLTGCSSKEKKITPNTRTTPPPPQRVDYFVVKTSPLTEKLELPGTIVANEVTEIHPEIAGRLTYLNITEGKRIPKGT
jgi:membrane fusion protein, multidrug efflux system